MIRKDVLGSSTQYVLPSPICVIHMQQVFVTIRNSYIPFENKRNSDGDII